MEISNAFVCAMGIGVVFLGLVCLVIICKITSLICCSGSKKEQDESATVYEQSDDTIQNKQEIIAAISAVVAEELNTDISAIRILSFKKM